jgi:hypothetical protein
MPLSVALTRAVTKDAAGQVHQTLSSVLGAGASGHADVFVVSRLPLREGVDYRDTQLVGVAGLGEYTDYPHGPLGPLAAPYLASTCVTHHDDLAAADATWADVKAAVNRLVRSVNSAQVVYAPAAETVVITGA